MRHLNIVYRSAGRPELAKITTYLRNGAPRSCWGCDRPFPLRDGRSEAQVGVDGRLYCHTNTQPCAVLAANSPALKRAS
jgi:hypothetical protein